MTTTVFQIRTAKLLCLPLSLTFVALIYVMTTPDLGPLVALCYALMGFFAMG